METPATPRNPRKPDGSLAALVRAESLIQIAVIIPGTVVAGWLLGLGADHLLHTSWLSIAGIVLGAAAAFLEVFHLIGKAAK